MTALSSNDTSSSNLNTAFIIYRQLEEGWYGSLSNQQLDTLTDRRRVPISELYLYGEVGFLLLGLKPTVLIEHLPKTLDILSSYIRSVVRIWLDRIVDLVGRFRLDKIEHELESSEMRLTGCYFLSKPTHSLFEKVYEIFLNPLILKAEENCLALVLDYPGSLPSNSDELNTMVRVGYVEKSSGAVLTVYAGQRRQLPEIKVHFNRYNQAYMEHFNLPLSLMCEDLI